MSCRGRHFVILLRRQSRRPMACHTFRSASLKTRFFSFRRRRGRLRPIFYTRRKHRFRPIPSLWRPFDRGLALSDVKEYAPPIRIQARWTTTFRSTSPQPFVVFSERIAQPLRRTRERDFVVNNKAVSSADFHSFFSPSLRNVRLTDVLASISEPFCGRGVFDLPPEPPV